MHSTALLESTVAPSALYDEVVMMEACEALGLASEPCTVTAGRCPVMEVAGVPHELIRWAFRRSEQIAACLADLDHRYVTVAEKGSTLRRALADLAEGAEHWRRTYGNQGQLRVRQARSETLFNTPVRTLSQDLGCGGRLCLVPRRRPSTRLRTPLVARFGQPLSW
ncbi:hypothetical protein ACIPSA_47570 [Streptomyces sp. NPDC086549]|uniref:hypothetical protein n=1 Tax=Streptomyces sp. NPDC086549 TaxID=3365752 RepID=UPI0037F239B3